MQKFLTFILSLLCIMPPASAMEVRGELKKAALEQLTADPVTFLAEGRIFWDTDDNLFRVYNGASWLSVADLTSTQTFTNKTLTSPKINENVALTTTATKLNYLTSATGTTGMTSTNVVFSTSPTLVTPILGTPQSVNLSNATDLPVGSITGLGTGIATWLATPTSANLLAAISDETGTGAAVFANTPTLVTPVLGVATATSVNGTTIPSSKTLVVTTDKLSVLAATSSSELAGVLSDETGSGLAVFGTSPTLTTPALGVATATSINGTTIPSSKTLVVTTDKLSVLAATSSSELAGVLSDETGTGKICLATSPQFSTNVDLLAAAETRYYNAGGTFYVGFKGGNAAANKIWTLPLADGSANQVLSTDGSGALSWATGLSSSLNQYNVSIGDSTNTATSVNTNLLGTIKGSTSSQAYTVTNASPAVFTVTGHGLNTGDTAYVTVTQNGFTASTTYYVHKIDADTFHLSTTRANSAVAVYINSSASTAGTIVYGGINLNSGTKGTVTNDDACASCVGEEIVAKRLLSNSTAITSNNATNVATSTLVLTPGDWDVAADVCYSPAAGTSISAMIIAVSATSATLPATDNIGTPNESQCEAYIQTAEAAFIPGASVVCGPTIRSYRCSVAVGATKTLYLVGRVTFTVSTNAVFGSVRARRVR